MDRRVIMIVLAGALLLSVGIAALAAGAMGGGNPDRPVVVHEPSTEVRSRAGSGIGFTDGDGVIAGRKPGVGSGTTAGSVTDSEILHGTSTGADVRAGGAAGGLNGGVVLGTDPVLAGGPGGCCECEPPWQCRPPAPQVQAGGLTGGVVGSRSDGAVLAGGAGGGVILNTNPAPARGVFGN